MANRTGKKWNKGGSMRRNHGMNIDFSCFEIYAEELENLGADLTKVFSEIMEDVGEEVQVRTKEAVADPHLPAGGKYRGNPSDTLAAIEMNPKPVVSGGLVEVGIGFDKSKPSPGGWLITGTPKMKPDAELEQIFVRKRYRNKMIKQINEALQDEIDDRMGKFK